MKREKSKLLPPVLELTGDNFTHNVWGGRWIPTMKNVAWKKTLPVGESWEFSSHGRHPSHVLLSSRASISLRSLIKKHGLEILGRSFRLHRNGEAPFLIKFIDAVESLSVQVHPGDHFAQRVEKSSGKSEGWVIMNVVPGRGNGFIYLGFRKKNKEAFVKALKNNRSPHHILSFLNKIKVRPGDVYRVPDGAVHAIGAGVRLFEIQQTSDLTYRIWDWNRADISRPLHWEKAFHVLDFRKRQPGFFRAQPKRVAAVGKGFFVERKILEEKDKKFAVNEIALKKQGSEIEGQRGGRFQVLTVTKGNVNVYTRGTRSAEFLLWGSLTQGRTVVIPATTAGYKLRAGSNETRILKSYVP
jgi:mannose-6-phosphate isomerase class I